MAVAAVRARFGRDEEDVERERERESAGVERPGVRLV
jgi:hypothetical protein